jgi:hypothetical protein
MKPMRKIEQLGGTDAFNYSSAVCRKLNEVISALNSLMKEPEIVEDQKYWIVGDNGNVWQLWWKNSPDDNTRRAVHNFFLTKEAAEEAAKRVRELLLSLRG